MNNDMKCPFCGKELKNINFMWFCENESCRAYDWTMEEAAWQELIRTRKELDVRKKQVEIANKAFDFINTEWDNVDCGRKELGACAFNAKEDIAGWESDIETALEQKDVK